VSEEVALEGGGFVRGIEIDVGDAGLRLRGRGQWREVSGVRAVGEVRSARLWLGTDHQGRNLMARVVHGARTTLVVASIATLVATLLGASLGLGASLAPAAARVPIEIGTDGLLGLPRLLLLLILGVALRGSTLGVGLAIGLASWMEVSRLIQAESLKLRGMPFVAAVEAVGVNRLRLAVRHLLPNLVPILAVVAPLVATQAILLEATLSFLGVGGSGRASWGAIVADGQRLSPSAWWVALFPGLLLCATAFAVHGLTRSEKRRPHHLVSP
jgi:peptide/nickel transport system permease protein